VSVKGESHAAVCTGLAAIAAKQGSRKSAPIQNKIVCSPFSRRSAMAARNFSDRIVPPFFRRPMKIDNAYEWHLLFVDALGERSEAIFTRCRCDNSAMASRCQE
jgi:hypothetical protein